MRTIVRNDCGHRSGVPTALPVQSKRRIRSPISPPPLKKISTAWWSGLDCVAKRLSEMKQPRTSHRVSSCCLGTLLLQRVGSHAGLVPARCASVPRALHPVCSSAPRGSTLPGIYARPALQGRTLLCRKERALMHRRQFIAAASAMALTRVVVSDAGDAGDPAAATSPLALDKLGVRGMVAAMQAGRLSSAQLTAHYLERIEALNRRGPKLAAVIETNPRALEIAHTLDRARVRGPL